ncbi:MAG: hypothetical protein M1813_005877 [Trichoglossum hirsutum]|nr:MAG: hypothetical protein M1813_005877 [Trichoglossum hirsutum]
MSKFRDPSAEEKSPTCPQPESPSKSEDPSSLEAQSLLSVEGSPSSLAWHPILLPLQLPAYLDGSLNTFFRFLKPILLTAIFNAIFFQLLDWGYTCYVLQRQYRDWALTLEVYWAICFPYGFWARFRPLPLHMLVQDFLDRLHSMLFVTGFYALGGSGTVTRLVDRVSFLRNRRRLRNAVWYLIAFAIYTAAQRGYISIAIWVGSSPSCYSICEPFRTCTLGMGRGTRSGYRKYWVRTRQG